MLLKKSTKHFILFTVVLMVNVVTGQINFIDRAESRGVDISCGTTYLGNGVSFYDYDQDGFDDITFATEAGQNVRFFKNTGSNGFVEDYLNISEINHQTKQVNWVDIDNDGDKDLYITSDTNGNRLFENDGNLNFIDITNSSGLPEQNIFTYGASWGDYNNDGYLDVFICSFDSNKVVPNYLYKNNGNNTFTNVSESAGISSLGHLSFCAAFFDYNNDGWQDIYISNDRIFNPNILYKNNGDGTFTDKSQESKSDIRIDAMSVTIDDFDKDGWFDIYVTNSPDDGNVFLRNNGNGTFTDIAPSTGTKVFGVCWGAVFLDAENDQDLDLYVSSSLNGTSVYNSSVFFENLGDNKFQSDINSGFFNDNKTSYSNAIGDVNNDGLYDIVVSNTDDEFINLWMNETVSNNNWLKIGLEGTVSNRDGIGAVIEISASGEKQYRYTLCGEGYLSQNSASEIFGVGSNTLVDYVKVKWLSGIEDYFYNIDVNQSLTLKEGTGSTVTPIYGCKDPNSCNFNPDATIDDGSCVFAETGSIIGNATSSPLRTETYAHSLTDREVYFWTVTNGEILNGQGTNAIKVKWDIASKGIVSVVNKGENCMSNVVSLEVPLAVDLHLEETNYSIARLWNELLLEAIRTDYARPTVHARNLFHTSIAMYDSWAIYNKNNETYLIGKELYGFLCDFDDFSLSGDYLISDAVNETLSFAVYRLLKHRFKESPNRETISERLNELMALLNYDVNYNSIDYSNGEPAALGNFIGSKIIEYGLQDGSNELNEYGNQYYLPVNESLAPIVGGNETISDPNRWQPLSLDVYIDQSGNIVSPTNSVPEFLSPEWGNTQPFSLKQSDKSTYFRNSNHYNVYHDPGPPPFIDTEDITSSNIYKWGFSLVSIWSSHLSPNDGIMWDISPRSIGNISSSLFPDDFYNYKDFYKLIEGGDIGNGHDLNPITNQAYVEQIVPRGDYTRVLAEFWADGPDSETPPGHWFVILNYINDHPLLQKKFEGKGAVLSDIEWEVKSYFILGGAMHDAAIAAWGIKGWYDYIRPISAIRYMADKGQSSEINLDNFNINGIPLVDGLIEVVNEDDPLAGDNGENVGKIKLFTWRGHKYIEDAETDAAGVGWILAENWWPYQRPSFVTPPFAGYVSGHSTYSRAAAEVLTKLTGSPFFPGGLGEFHANKNEFLVFEEGPSQDIVLQWATYRDASDQCSLSRIWGGIHPPMDDIPGRIIGEKIGVETFNFAKKYFDNQNEKEIEMVAYPNPVGNSDQLFINNTDEGMAFELFNLQGKNLPIDYEFNKSNHQTKIRFVGSLSTGIYILRTEGRFWKIALMN
ncbi:VCBS repeat-containing protein [Snuella sp. CAU 1569]|uniref:VCBS repeat-containing protein n=2 Tax=Snuella sedimenti TaxID=2798802 RepID=A0A8J7LML6_9FLAO|nr:VCBS repeat-containing protein [Snuella sedimenti]